MTTRVKAGIVAGVTFFVLIGLCAMLARRIIADLRQNPPSYFIFQPPSGVFSRCAVWQAMH